MITLDVNDKLPYSTVEHIKICLYFVKPSLTEC